MPGIWPQNPPYPRRPAQPTAPRPVKWVATPPVTTKIHTEDEDREDGSYDGPPSYPAPPRWGFPTMPWRPSSVAASPKRPSDVVLAGAGTTASTILAAFSLVAAIAGVLEFWRYGLLAASRHEALSTTSVTTSNAMAATFATSAAIVGAVGIVLAVRWFLLARGEAGRLHHVVLPRSSREVLLRLCGVWGVLVVVALVVAVFRVADFVTVIVGPILIGGAVIASAVTAGPVVAELEHVAMGGRPSQRPRPSRIVLAWWAFWVINTGCAAAALWLRMRGGIQAEADAMFMTALTQLSASVVALLTVIAMRRIARLLAPPPDDVDRYLIVGVKGAPAPPLRTVRPATSPR